jgi:hypothetical protein
MLFFVHAGLKLTMKRQVDGWQWLEGFRVMHVLLLSSQQNV